jgi:hypothetical protein
MKQLLIALLVIIGLSKNQTFAQVVAPAMRGFIIKPELSWELVSDDTKPMTQAWSQTLTGTNVAKQYKIIVSGTWGIANGNYHRDAAYDCGSSNTIGVSGTPVANRGCDANWSLNGNCPPPVPDLPAGYATDNTYTYLLGQGRAQGFTIAFSDGYYGDNRGSLRFKLYQANL